MSKAKKLCPVCGANRVGPIKVWRRLTGYVDPTMNLLRSCVHCIRLDDTALVEQWAGIGIREVPPQRVGRRPPIPARRTPADLSWLDDLFND